MYLYKGAGIRQKIAQIKTDRAQEGQVSRIRAEKEEIEMAEEADGRQKRPNFARPGGLPRLRGEASNPSKEH